MTTIYTTKDELVERYVVEALGGYPGDYDVRAIADEISEYVHTGNAAHDGYAVTEQGVASFWDVAARHRGHRVREQGRGCSSAAPRLRHDHDQAQTDAQIYIDNGGILTLVRDNVAWVADWYPGDREQAIEAAESWNSGEWEPNEQDGWTCVSTDWQAVLDAEYDRDEPSPTVLLRDYEGVDLLDVLAGAATEHDRLSEATDAARDRLYDAIRDAVRGGVTKTEVSRVSGVSRPTIDKILG